jgi:hypothetical protein
VRGDWLSEKESTLLPTNKMTDSLQDYFSNLMGCGGLSMAIVSDNARARSSFNNSSGHLDWLTDCCSMDTTSTTLSTPGCGFNFSRWDSEPPQHTIKRDTAIKRPRRRALGEGSDDPGDEGVAEDYAAIFLDASATEDGQGSSSNMKRLKHEKEVGIVGRQEHGRSVPVV